MEANARAQHGDQVSQGQQPGANWTALERNWRKVASTHTLQELLADDSAESRRKPSLKLLLLGVFLVVLGVASLGLATFAMVVAPMLAPSHNKLVAALQSDNYYHLLVPLTVPVTIFMIFLNWFSMKLFKHNS